MTLAAGSRIGAYEILGPLGAGGMGEVYRARDPHLKREVALKVLPEAFARDADRVARFQREAELLASLNHPHVAAVYGLERTGTTTAIVLELVEGETLADLIARGPIALAEALPIARQIAEALEAAHERGIVHRDLKPANVKVTPDGAVKVLDFGLAKLVDPAEDRPGAAAMTMSPTLSLQGTFAGTVLGTAAYMSPEQARGKTVDRRADIWAFGCVIYEMLSGRRTFDPGDTISDTVAAVLKNDPDWTALPVATPPRVRDLLRRCVVKDARNRLRDIGDARIAIDEVMADPAPAPAALPRAAGRPKAVWLALGVAVLAIAAAVGMWLTRPPQSTATLMRLHTDTGTAMPLVLGTGPAAFLSPDGTRLGLVTGVPGQPPLLSVRRLDQFDATVLAGTEGARNAFFSPDGEWIAFFSGGSLKKVSVAGGRPITLAEAEDDRGGTWTRDGWIVYAPTTRSGLMKIPENGGVPSPLTTLDAQAGEITHRWPRALPGGKGVLFVAHDTSNDYNQGAVALVTGAGERRSLHRGGYAPQYSASGHVVFMSEGRVFALPFDPDALEVRGDPVPILEGVSNTSNNGTGQLSLAANGTAAYVTGETAGGLAIFLEADMPRRLAGATPANYMNLRYAPDGRRLAMEMGRNSIDIYSYDTARDALTRLTFDAMQDRSPVWSPEGRYLAFGSQRGDRSTFNLYWQNADGSGEAHRLTESRNRQVPTSWHPGGGFLLFTEDTLSASDVMILPLNGDETSGYTAAGPATPFANSRFTESGAVFSPDGRWVAYASSESRTREVYVRPFRGAGGRTQISTAGGNWPAWSARTNELLFADLSGTIMSVAYRVTGDAFSADPPRVRSTTRPFPMTAGRNYDVHPGTGTLTYLALADETAAAAPTLAIVTGYLDELRRLAPPMR